MSSVKPLEEEDFQLIVKKAPLFAIDLVVVNEKNEVLLGKRINAPAKDYWFVPGGRVYKNESLPNAFIRISRTELGTEFSYHQAKFLGLYEHFYKESFFSEQVSTHYINATHLIRANNQYLKLPKEQHLQYRWCTVQTLLKDPDVHKYSKLFITELEQYFGVYKN